MKCLLLVLPLLLLGAGVTGACAEETYRFDGAWGSPGLGNDQFLYPMDIALDGAGDVYVADRDNMRVKRFTATGGFVGVLGADSTDAAMGVTAAGGRIYVSYPDYVRVFSPAGNDLGQWGTHGPEPGNLSDPRGMAVDPAGRVYIADTFNNRVQAFWPNGTLHAGWKIGQGSVSLNSPSDVAVNASGYVYVTDSWNNRVQVFSPNPDAGVVGGWGVPGDGPGEFDTPSGIAIDRAGAVYVVDTYNHRVQKFSPTGGFLATWGVRGSGSGQFMYPWGVAVAGDGTVYVGDQYNHRIQRWRPGLPPVPGGSNAPTDTNGDGLYDDVNGNGRRDMSDIVLYFNQMAWVAANEPVPAFDYNRNGRIDFGDVVWLFNHT